jgi:predicted short-subunit dehydrogenase-like oxidoreductase (DUF2520 family)
MKRKTRFVIAVVGGGKVGSVLGRLLVDHGQRVACIVSRTVRTARIAGRFVGCRHYATDLNALPSGINLVLIATPHETIPGVAGELATLKHLNFRRLAVCHTSGMLTAQVLAPVSDLGATTFSFHPLQTFPRDFAPRRIVRSIPGIFYGVDGSVGAVACSKRLAKALGGTVILVPPEMREFYHAACVVASNHLTALLRVLERMYDVLGTRKVKFLPVFRPIIEATLNNVEASSPARALSGPVARGGVPTVERHLDSLVQHAPDVLSYFLAMTEETIDLARVKGSITEDQKLAMNKLIASYRQVTS